MNNWDDIKSKSILVTGGAGFIGSNLVGKLLELGVKKVRVLDNFSTGKKKNLEDFFNSPVFELIEGDIRDLSICQEACDGMDYVSHQAALGSVPRSINDPITTNEVNISGFLNILLAASNNGVKRIVYAASSSTYGDSKSLPKVEEVIGKPLSPYAVTKYVNELYAHVFALHYGVETIGLRYFNVFGPKQSPKGAYAAVIPLFIQAILNGDSPYINGKGEQTRDFTYVDNVVQANINSMLTDNRNAINQVFNIAIGGQTSIKEMFDILVGIEGKNILPNFREARKGDVQDSLADILKAKTLINYEPKIAFKEGLIKTYEWIKNNQYFINE